MREDEVKRGPLLAAIKDSLREVGLQLSLLNHRVSARLELRDVDVDCLNLVHRHGPISPSELGTMAGLRRSTITGILDRLEGDGWLARGPDPHDRRAVLVTALPDRSRELFGLLSGMNDAMGEILGDYEREELQVIADFLRRTADAGRAASEDLGA